MRTSRASSSYGSARTVGITDARILIAEIKASKICDALRVGQPQPFDNIMLDWWFRRKTPMAQQVRDGIDEFNETQSQFLTIPADELPPCVTIGEDVDLEKLVKTLGPIQLKKIRTEKAKLYKQLDILIDKELRLLTLMDEEPIPLA